MSKPCLKFILTCTILVASGLTNAYCQEKSDLSIFSKYEFASGSMFELKTKNSDTIKLSKEGYCFIVMSRMQIFDYRNQLLLADAVKFNVFSTKFTSSCTNDFSNVGRLDFDEANQLCNASIDFTKKNNRIFFKSRYFQIIQLDRYKDEGYKFYIGLHDFNLNEFKNIMEHLKKLLEH